MATPYYRPFYPATYNNQLYGMQPQYIPTAQTQQPAVQTPDSKFPMVNGFSWVDGINAAKAQNIPFGSSWIFFDAKEPIFYIKTVGADGVPLPLYVASYKQINENELNSSEPAKPTLDLSGYLKKEDLDTSKFATKEDISELLDTIIENNKNYLTDKNLEEKITQILQDKIGGQKSAAKATTKED